MNNDLTSRKTLIKWIDDSVSQYGHTYSTDMLNMWGLFKDYLINNAPTVELTEEQAIDKLHETGWLIRHDKEMTERPKGRWEEGNHGDYERPDYYFQCSVCKEETDDTTPYCPFCGSRMKGGAE